MRTSRAPRISGLSARYRASRRLWGLSKHDVDHVGRRPAARASKISANADFACDFMWLRPACAARQLSCDLEDGAPPPAVLRTAAPLAGKAPESVKLWTVPSLMTLIGRVPGELPRSKVSIMIMRPRQRGQG
jgi:hypothetical protein